MYQRHPSWVIGFHGTTEDVVKSMINLPSGVLLKSNNDYDWLGQGVYFWENDPVRALQFAEKFKAHDGKIAAVVGAVIDLGLCMNMFEQRALQELKMAHGGLAAEFAANREECPANHGKTGDKVFRRLDMLVFEEVHKRRAGVELVLPGSTPPYDTVRAGFSEGQALYDGTSICEFNHIQIAVRSAKSIKGYFLPRG